VNADGSPKAPTQQTRSPHGVVPQIFSRRSVSTPSRRASSSPGNVHFTARPRTVRFQDDQAARAPEPMSAYTPRRNRTPTNIRHNDPNEVSVAER
jgi:hypothetical protein